MDSLFAVTINGTMLYVKGILSDKECIEVEKIANNFQSTRDLVDFEVICQAFIKAVETSLNISLVQVPLKYVFRIKQK